MTRIATLYSEITVLPESLQQEVLDYIGFLSSKYVTSEEKITPQFGSSKGKYILQPVFDDPLEDFKEYME
ncbi:MAG: DUF2281 domain-containing protein [Ignavibacteria bacterium]|nr:DUF2281 domain-containing protein [Ignavibacteria bacterium]